MIVVLSRGTECGEGSWNKCQTRGDLIQNKRRRVLQKAGGGKLQKRGVGKRKVLNAAQSAKGEGGVENKWRKDTEGGSGRGV